MSIMAAITNYNVSAIAVYDDNDDPSDLTAIEWTFSSGGLSVEYVCEDPLENRTIEDWKAFVLSLKTSLNSEQSVLNSLDFNDCNGYSGIIIDDGSVSFHRSQYGRDGSGSVIIRVSVTSELIRSFEDVIVILEK